MRPDDQTCPQQTKQYATAITSAFFVKEYFPVTSSGGNQCKNRTPRFGILANHKIKMCYNSREKNNDTKDYSEQLEFLNTTTTI